MTEIWKNVYIDKLGNIVNKNNKPYHRTTTMKLSAFKDKTYIDYSVEDLRM